MSFVFNPDIEFEDWVKYCWKLWRDNEEIHVVGGMLDKYEYTESFIEKCIFGMEAYGMIIPRDSMEEEGIKTDITRAIRDTWEKEDLL